ncbi:MAG TPA: alpha/beta fold hydrolase, partial [Anaerolineales bacterium]
MIIPTAEPFIFPGNKIGCLLIHGFTGAPKEMRWMGEYLSGRGYSVLGVRLAGHATDPKDMQRMKWQDWLESVEDGYCLLKGMADKVFVMGLSMGGILSLLFAAHQPVAGVVVMSVPYDLPNDPRLRFAKLLAGIVPKVGKAPADWHNLEAAKDHVEYPYLSTKGIVQLHDLL